MTKSSTPSSTKAHQTYDPVGIPAEFDVSGPAIIECGKTLTVPLNICAADSASAEQKARNAVKGNYACEPHCDLLVNALATKVKKKDRTQDCGPGTIEFKVIVFLTCS